MKKSVKKSLMLMVSLLLIIGVTVGGTIAFLITTSGPVANTFKPSEVTVEVNETFDGKVKSDVSIKNTGDTTAYIRAAVVITWQNEAGEVYGKAPVEGTDYEISYNEDVQTAPTGQWLEVGDFYYWNSPVEANKNTGILINTVDNVVRPADVPNDYHLCVEILASGVQSEPDKVVNEAWKAVKVDTDGTTLVNVS